MPDDTYDTDWSDNDLTRLSVAAKREGTTLTAWVHFGVTVVFTYTGDTSDFPAGIEDFTGMAFRRFSERLARLLADDTNS